MAAAHDVLAFLAGVRAVAGPELLWHPMDLYHSASPTPGLGEC